jgi:hypothetical protein
VSFDYLLAAVPVPSPCSGTGGVRASQGKHRNGPPTFSFRGRPAKFTDRKFLSTPAGLPKRAPKFVTGTWPYLSLKEIKSCVWAERLGHQCHRVASVLLPSPPAYFTSPSRASVAGCSISSLTACRLNCKRIPAPLSSVRLPSSLAR